MALIVKCSSYSTTNHICSKNDGGSENVHSGGHGGDYSDDTSRIYRKIFKTSKYIVTKKNLVDFELSSIKVPKRLDELLTLCTSRTCKTDKRDRCRTKVQSNTYEDNYASNSPRMNTFFFLDFARQSSYSTDGRKFP